MKKTLYALILLLFTAASVHAQLVRFSGSADTFVEEMKTVMATGNNTFAVQSAASLANYWSSSLSASQQQQLIQLSQEMAKRGHKMPQYYQLLRLVEHVTLTEKYDAASLSSFLDILHKILSTSPLKKGNDAMEWLNEFLRTKRLYTSNFNTLYAVNGSYSFRYVEKETPYFEDNATTTVASSQVFDSWDTPPASEPTAAVVEATKKNVTLPLATELVIDFKQVDLAFVTASDSVLIKQTKGGVIWHRGLFVGSGGTVNWSSVGLPQVQASLKTYVVELRNPRFSAADVTLSYPDRLQTPVTGVLEFKGGKRPAGVPNTYPRFMSYETNAVLKNQQRGIAYTGGFSLMGKQIVSSSVINSYSTIEVKEGNRHHFKLVSDKFFLTDSLITADRASFVAYSGKDSIVHPAIKLYYNIPQQLVRLNKVDGGGYQSTPFSDSYHQMEIKCDAMRWDLATQRMDFYIVSGKGEVPVVFESFNYFNPRRVSDLSGTAGYNPLLVVGNYARKTNKFSFTLDELAASVGRPVQQLSGGILATAQMGLLSFDPFTKRYTISAKGKHYIQAFAGQKDYDDFFLTSFYKSTDSTANGSLDLGKMELTIRGTKEFVLSDSLGISLRPRNDKVDMKRNRTFSFDGDLIVKNYRFTGKNIDIDYDNFVVKLNQIEAIHFIPLAIYRGGGKKELGGHIQYPHPATLYLNKANNKSGKLQLPEYPRLVMEKGVKVYFNEPVRGSAGFEKAVYFDIPSIDFDSLNTKDIAWEGTFHSGGIFAPFKEKLIVMPDTTLGFTHQVPTGSYAVYGTPSTIKFASPLQLTKRGLVASGDLTHLAATLKANTLSFRTNQLIGRGPSGGIKETTTKGYFPAITMAEYAMRWQPKTDSLVLLTDGKPFQLYNNSTQFTGQLVVREKGVFADGVLDRTDSRTQSEGITFDKNGFKASPSTFTIKATDANAKPILAGNHVLVDFNVPANRVNIGAVASSFNDSLQTSLEFPLAAYRTNISQATWAVNDKKVSMKGDVKDTRFTATAPAQEGLSFSGSEAIYDISAMTLTIEGVPDIVSADARILPNKKQVIIQQEGKMQPLVNAQITIDTLNGFHNLTNGNIRILSKNKFSGDATYQFVNANNEKYPIKMGNFELRDVNEGKATRNTKLQPLFATTAKATLSVKDSVFLSPRILYKGDITMVAPQKNLELDGAVMPSLKKYPLFQLGGNWIAYQGSKSEDVAITVDEQLQSNNIRLYSGLHLRADAAINGLYPTFLSMKKLAEDENIFVAKGTFRRDEPAKSYVVKSNDLSTGNELTLSDVDNTLRLTGTYNLFSGGAEKYIRTTGLGEIALDSNRYTFDWLFAYDFPLPMPILQSMGAAIIKANLDLGNSDRAIEVESPLFLPKFAPILGQKEAAAYQNQLQREHVPLFKFSPKMAGSIVVSKAEMKYFPKANAFYNISRIGVSNIGENDINALVPGYIEVLKNPIDGDQMTLLLELSQDIWYYLSYKNGELAAVSSDKGFNDLVVAKEKGGKKEKDYALIPADLSDAAVFRRRFMTNYLGIKDPKKAAPPAAKPDAKKKTEEKEGF